MQQVAYLQQVGYPVQFSVDYADRPLNRLSTAFRIIVVIVAWFAILFTGRYPQGMFGFVEGVIRWNVRVTAYTLTLVTDRYPPFRLDP